MNSFLAQIDIGQQFTLKGNKGIGSIQAFTSLRAFISTILPNVFIVAGIILIFFIIGSGIGMQAQIMTSKGKLNDRVNDEIEEVWERWSRAENCHTGGSLSFTDYERMAVGQVFDAGEVFNRKYYTIFGESEVPFDFC